MYNGDKKVLLFGSAISIWEPSTIANGRTISNVLLNYLFGKSSVESWMSPEYLTWLSNLPFEHINDCCPIDLSTFYSKLLNTSTPNFFHKEIAKLADNGQVKALLTTNYDQGIEHALSIENNVNVFYEPEKYNNSKTSYFKLHGSAESPSSMVYRLAQESKLPTEKRKILNKIIKGNQLVIIGYSGIDFEICPSIIDSQPKEILWYVRPKDKNKDKEEEETVGYKFVSQHIKVTRKEWDLENGLPWKTTSEKLSVAKTIDENILNQLDKEINGDDKLLWALNLCSKIGYPKYSTKLLAKSHSHRKIDYIKQDALADFHAGRYKDAANKFKIDSQNKLKTKNYNEAVISLTNRIESLLCYGSFVKAIVAFFSAYLISHKYCNNISHPYIDNKIVRVLVELNRIMSMFKVNLPNRLQIKILERNIKYFETNGDVFEMYTAKEHHMEFTENNTYEAGFKHLSVPVGFSRSTRLKMENNSEINLLKKSYYTVRRMGCNAEAWKLASMLKLLDRNKLLWKKRQKECVSLLQQTYLCRIIHSLLIWRKCQRINANRKKSN